MKTVYKYVRVYECLHFWFHYSRDKTNYSLFSISYVSVTYIQKVMKNPEHLDTRRIAPLH